MTDHNIRRYHKRIRLDAPNYLQPGAICSVTLAVQGRRPIFADPVATAAVEVLRQQAEKAGVRVLGYCVMPDHIHLVLSPSPGYNIVTFVGQYKNLLQRAAWQLGVKGAFWQKSFWDRFLRIEEQIEPAVSTS